MISVAPFPINEVADKIFDPICHLLVLLLLLLLLIFAYQIYLC